MRKRYWALIIIVLLLSSLAILAHIPSVIPSGQAINNVEHSQSFENIVANNSYYYEGYSNDPTWDMRCVGTVFGDVLHFFSPFHEYTTTTLMFFVQPSVETVKNGTVSGTFGVLLVEVNPSTGRIYNLSLQPSCA